MFTWDNCGGKCVWPWRPNILVQLLWKVLYTQLIAFSVILRWWRAQLWGFSIDAKAQQNGRWRAPALEQGENRHFPSQMFNTHIHTLSFTSLPVTESQETVWERRPGKSKSVGTFIDDLPPPDHFLLGLPGIAGPREQWKASDLIWSSLKFSSEWENSVLCSFM